MNAGIIVFREGLEAVVIFASLMSSLKSVEERKYRKPMWLGSLLALLATGLTWLLAHEVLQSLARYGEKLEAVVSILAIAVLLVIMNWFFHKTYWTSWLANFHATKRRLLNEETGLFLGLIALGFTSVYREGFEIVLFLQALVLEGGVPVVLMGVIGSSLAVALVGMIVFRLQKNLPYMKILDRYRHSDRHGVAADGGEYRSCDAGGRLASDPRDSGPGFALLAWHMVWNLSHLGRVDLPVCRHDLCPWKLFSGGGDAGSTGCHPFHENL